jgi:nucleoside-diphosphate-sugar epimerase
MRILVIGGTGFLGPPLVRQLADLGHEVAVFHRGNTTIDLPAEHILGSRSDLPAIRPKADVVLDLILSSGAQARALMDTLRGLARRVVAASSVDVYRACGVFHGSEEGPIEPTPLTEDSPLRTKLQTYPPEQVKMLQQVFPWLDDEYDKIPVERAILGDPDLPGAVLRLPMIYGPGDRLHRLRPLLQQMDAGGPIRFDPLHAAWRGPRGYVENVAAALALAAIDDRAIGRIYNVVDRPAFSELEWAQKVAEVAGWTGEIAIGAADRPPGNLAQHWEADSTRIREELGWREIVPVDDAIRRTIEWERAQPL